ncbi:hypothetical protein AVEN_245278-1 [Araneus ventricosus]|uniref:Uncharacterized protein n=1 Tax=Araneus ventricosus TaxID=182803 RepID=A0A4Y2VAC0_ARAVE|nr:hypothetical protein AVEN_245278-1 [Araneus ventricosus]
MANSLLFVETRRRESVTRKWHSSYYLLERYEEKTRISSLHRKWPGGSYYFVEMKKTKNVVTPQVSQIRSYIICRDEEKVRIGNTARCRIRSYLFVEMREDRISNTPQDDRNSS